MKEFIELIKKLWANKKHRSIVILLLYLVFFVLVFSILDRTPSIPTDDNLKPSNPIVNKEYKIQIVGEENFIVDKNTIIYNGNNYSIDSGVVDLNKYNVHFFERDNINKIINNGKLETINYINNSKSYLADIKVFDSSKTGEFRIIVYEDKIEVDLSNYFNYKVILN